MLFYVHSSTIHNSQDMEQPKRPLTDEWIKLWYVYTMEYSSAIKIKDKLMLFTATWMDPEIITLRKVSQKEKHKYHIISLTCRI